jgi:hypothetical protein
MKLVDVCHALDFIKWDHLFQTMLDNDNVSVLFLNSFVQFLNFISIMEFSR